MFAQAIIHPLIGRPAREARRERPADLIPLLWTRLSAAGIDVLSTGRDAETGRVRIEVIASAADAHHVTTTAQRAVAGVVVDAAAGSLHIETITPELAFALPRTGR